MAHISGTQCMPIIHGSCRRKSIVLFPSCLKLAVEAGIIHVGNDARLTAALAEGIAGESSVLGEYADGLGEFRRAKLQ